MSGIKIACFIICSTLAAVAGILFASKDNSVSPSTGGSTTLLFAVAAVVIGTSLFGGKGRSPTPSCGLVVVVIANGLPLITDKAGIQFIVTGLVLLVAASVDALYRAAALDRSAAADARSDEVDPCRSPAILGTSAPPQPGGPRPVPARPRVDLPLELVSHTGLNRSTVGGLIGPRRRRPWSRD